MIITDETKKPRVIVATTAFAPLVGGAEVATQEYIKQLKDEFDFVVVTARIRHTLPARDTWNGVPVIRVGWGTVFDKLWLIIILPWHIARLRTHESVVWAIMASYAGAGACFANILSGVPYALTLQEGDNLPVLERRLRYGMTLFRKIFMRARGIQVIAPFLSDWAMSLRAAATPVVVPNGVSTQAFTISDEQRAEWRHAVRSELYISLTAPVVLTISRLVEKNGLTDLIEAIREIPECHLIIIGEGKLEAALKVQCADFAQRVHFVGSKQSSDIVRYAAAADLFSRPSLTEGFGNVFLEAMCMGLPVVATNVGGIPTIISHGENGLLVHPHAPIALRGAIADVLSNPDRTARLRNAGYQTAQKFRWENLAPRISAWLRSCLAS